MLPDNILAVWHVWLNWRQTSQTVPDACDLADAIDYPIDFIYRNRLAMYQSYSSSHSLLLYQTLPDGQYPLLPE